MVLRYLKRSGKSSPKIEAKAQKYLQNGYERLLNYRSRNGGFSYWGRDASNLTLTAYALKFLIEAKEFVEVDNAVIDNAQDWLIKQQKEDGSWPYLVWPNYQSNHRNAIETAYIAQVLSSIKNETSKSSNTVKEAQERALEYLSKHVKEIDEPYLMSSYALAALNSSDIANAERVIDRLRKNVRKESDNEYYWYLEANTPFYGWGLAGRIETTAVVLKALLAYKKANQTNRDSSSSIDELIDRGLLFLIRKKDAYGVWFSTQATVNVLDTLITLSEADTQIKNDSVPAEIIVNGHPVTSINIPSMNELSEPIRVDLTKFISADRNKIEMRTENAIAKSNAQVITSYYVPWSGSSAHENTTHVNSSDLRLKVTYDQTNVEIGKEITCKVKAERVGYRGYGMMLAEIGLPPGADVDRASLEEAMRQSMWEINQYDVLPDKVVIYLWPKAGGINFEFKFKVRYGIAAQTAASVLYDYYNPEARVVVAPTKFIVR
jgi:uncharacterized protein YfaS (alpha-2-macroglobulin family)